MWFGFCGLGVGCVVLGVVGFFRGSSWLVGGYCGCVCVVVVCVRDRC